MVRRAHHDVVVRQAHHDAMVRRAHHDVVVRQAHHDVVDQGFFYWFDGLNATQAYKCSFVPLRHGEPVEPFL